MCFENPNRVDASCAYPLGHVVVAGRQQKTPSRAHGVQIRTPPRRIRYDKQGEKVDKGGRTTATSGNKGQQPFAALHRKR